MFGREGRREMGDEKERERERWGDDEERGKGEGSVLSVVGGNERVWLRSRAVRS